MDHRLAGQLAASWPQGEAPQQLMSSKHPRHHSWERCSWQWRPAAPPRCPPAVRCGQMSPDWLGYPFLQPGALGRPRLRPSSAAVRDWGRPPTRERASWWPPDPPPAASLQAQGALERSMYVGYAQTGPWVQPRRVGTAVRVPGVQQRACTHGRVTCCRNGLAQLAQEGTLSIGSPRPARALRAPQDGCCREGFVRLPLEGTSSGRAPAHADNHGAAGKGLVQLPQRDPLLQQSRLPVGAGPSLQAARFTSEHCGKCLCRCCCSFACMSTQGLWTKHCAGVHHVSKPHMSWLHCWQQGPTCGTALAVDAAVCLQPQVMLRPADWGQSCWPLAKRIAARGIWQLTIACLPHILFVPVFQQSHCECCSIF